MSGKIDLTHSIFEKYDTYSVLKYASIGFANANWFSDTYDAFTDLLKGYDIHLFVKVFAVTSPLAHPQTNVILALRAYNQIRNNRSVTELKILNSVKAMLCDIQAGTFDVTAERNLARRKILHFVNAILGDTEAVPLDSWMCRVVGIERTYKWNGKTYYRLPTKEQSDELIPYIRKIAGILGYEPRQLMAMIWAGIRIKEGKFKNISTKHCLVKALA